MKYQDKEYRILIKGEAIEAGDLWRFKDGSNRLSLVSPAWVGVNHAEDSGFNNAYVYREIEDLNAWVNPKERKPTEKDQDSNGRVQIIYPDGSGGNCSALFAATSFCKAWRRIAPVPCFLPPLPAPIKVGEDTATFERDGSVTVGCTLVSSELFDKLAAARKQAMGKE